MTGRLAHRLAAFLKVALEAAWDGCGLDGGAIQDTAEAQGLIVATTYDPAIHGDNGDAEPGDHWFIIAPDVAALGRD